MSIEKLVTSFELSKRCDEAGIKLETVFGWRRVTPGGPLEPILELKEESAYVLIASPTLQEWLDWLPFKINTENVYYLDICTGSACYSRSYVNDSGLLCYQFSKVFCPTPNGLAELALWLNQKKWKREERTQKDGRVWTLIA